MAGILDFLAGKKVLQNAAGTPQQTPPPQEPGLNMNDEVNKYMALKSLPYPGTPMAPSSLIPAGTDPFPLAPKKKNGSR